MMEMANARQRREARKLLKIRNGSMKSIQYRLTEPILTDKVGGHRFYLVIGKRVSDGEEWNYVLANCYGEEMGWFPNADVRAQFWYTLDLCVNCVQVAAYDEWSGIEPGSPQPLHRIPPADLVTIADEIESDMNTTCEGCGTIGNDPMYRAEVQHNGKVVF